MTFINLIPPTYYNVMQYGAKGNGVTDDTAAIQALINTLPACMVYDGANLPVAGKTGTLFFPPGVYAISGLLTIPPGDITIQGSGMSSWIPINGISGPYENIGGTAIVTTDYADGLINAPVDIYGYNACVLNIRDIDLRTVSPSTAQTTSTPPILGLSGWLNGEMRNVNVLECASTGGIGKNLYKIIDASAGAGKAYTAMYRVSGYGGAIGICINGAHFTAIDISGGWNGAGITAYNRAIEIADNLGNFFANLHCFSSTYGLMLTPYLNHVYTPLVIYGAMFEAVSHYIEVPAFTVGTIIIEKPCWNVNLDPIADIAPPQITTTTNVITKYEQHEPTSGGQFSKHITVASSSQTAGTSPYTLTLQPYDQIAVITTVGGMTALTLDGQALFNGSFTVGQQVYVGAGHTLIATWATTAPVFKLLPQ